MITAIAWRNIWRHRRRSWITIGAIAFAIWVMCLTRSLQYGSYASMETEAIRLLQGDIQISRTEYQDEKSLNYHFSEDELDFEVIEQSAGIAAISPRISGFSLVAAEDQSNGAMVLGIVPEKEPKVTGFLNKHDDLEPLTPGSIYIGKDLAQVLQVDLGSELVLITQGYQNQMGAELGMVKGILRTGMAELDRTLLVMHIEQAQTFFSLEGYTQLVLQTQNYRQAQQIGQNLQTKIGSEFEVYDWKKLMPELVQMVAWDNVGGAIMLGFLILIVGFEIMNTSMMNIVERKRELGVLASLGMRNGQLVRMVIMEHMFKSLMALVIGFSLAWATLMFIKPYPLPMSQKMKDTMNIFGPIPDIYFTLDPVVFLQPTIAIFFMALLAAIVPIFMTLRLKPLNAIRDI